MAESLFTSQTPATPDANDSQLYTLGTRITISVAGSVTAIRWFYPTVLPGTAIQGVLYDPSGLEFGRATFATPVAGAWNQVNLPSPVAVTAGQLVVASILTHDHYVLSPDASVFPLTNGHLSAASAAGRFVTSDAVPGSGGTSCYFVDLVFSQGGTGTATSAFGALGAAATGVRKVLGTAAATLGGLSMSAFAGSVGAGPRLVSAVNSSRLVDGAPSPRITSSTRGGRL